MSLIENTLFGRVDKVQIAIDRICQFEPPEGYYVAFSGGKDSCVVKDLVKRSGVKADYHYNLTTVDPPELVYFIREHPEVEVHKPKETMWELIRRKADLPTRRVRWCCSILKEGGGNGRFVITGVRWAESSRRAQRPMVEMCNQKAKRILNPIIDWSDNDVWEYLHGNNVPYCSLYNDGWDRLGCILCPMVSSPEKKLRDIQRWPKIYASYVSAIKDAFPKMIERKADDNIIWKSYEEWLNWWLWDKGHEKQDPDQTVMFE